MKMIGIILNIVEIGLWAAVVVLLVKDRKER